MRYNRSIKSLVTLSLVGFATLKLERSRKQNGGKTEADFKKQFTFCAKQILTKKNLKP